MVDCLLVKCMICGQTGLQRCSFDEHIGKTCPKWQVQFPSADIKCPWVGPRDQLDNHVATCVFQSLRSLLTDLMAKDSRLEEQIKQQETKMNSLQNQITSM